MREKRSQRTTFVRSLNMQLRKIVTMMNGHV